MAVRLTINEWQEMAVNRIPERLTRSLGDLQTEPDSVLLPARESQLNAGQTEAEANGSDLAGTTAQNEPASWAESAARAAIAQPVRSPAAGERVGGCRTRERRPRQ
jgi:hypothetical protein